MATNDIVIHRVQEKLGRKLLYFLEMFAVLVTLDLVVVGKLAIDELTLPTYRYPPVLGGSAAHVALAAATVGSKVAIVASIGDDFPTEFLDILRAKDIDLSGVIQRPGLSSHFWADFAPNGSMANYGLRFGVGTRFSLRSFKRLAAQARSIHLGILPPSLQRKLIQRVCQGDQLLSMTTIFHQAREYRDRIIPQLPYLDIFFLNAEEACIFAGTTDLTQAIQQLGNTIPLVVITQGAKGCLINDGGRILHVPGVPIEHVDSTGAGDSFAGAFLGRYLETGDIQEAAMWGNAAGALNVSAVGCTRFITATRQNLQHLIEQMPAP